MRHAGKSSGRFAVLALLTLVGCGGSSGNAAIQSNMMQLSIAYNAAMAATDLPAFTLQVEKLKAAAKVVETEKYLGAKASAPTYEAGVQELATAVEAVDAATARGELAAAKAALEKVSDLRRTYHIKLGL